jgi:hypothetical protein
MLRAVYHTVAKGVRWGLLEPLRHIKMFRRRRIYNVLSLFLGEML